MWLRLSTHTCTDRMCLAMGGLVWEDLHYCARRGWYWPNTVNVSSRFLHSFWQSPPHTGAGGSSMGSSWLSCILTSTCLGMALALRGRGRAAQTCHCALTCISFICFYSSCYQIHMMEGIYTETSCARLCPAWLVWLWFIHGRRRQIPQQKDQTWQIPHPILDEDQKVLKMQCSPSGLFYRRIVLLNDNILKSA